jgi:PAS domain S-box-containing protein
MSEKIKILYLESIPNDSEFINAALKNPEVDFEISVVTHLANFLETITIVSPDVILTDCSTSSFNTFQALKILGNNSLKVPLILLTVKSFEDTALSLLERGACDYLFKDELTRLPQAIKNATEKHQLEVKQQELLNKLAARDEIEHINGELDLFLNTIDEVFFSRDMIKSQLIRISPECERVYGYNVAEFMANQNLHNSMIYPDDMHIKQSHLAQLKNGDRVMSSYRIVHKDGSTRWVQTKIIPTLNNNGILVRIDGISRDITEAIKAGEKLKLSEERYRTLIENSSDMLMVSNQNGLITYTSPNIKKILGYTAEEFDKERKSAESFHPDDPEHYKTPFIESRDNPGKVYHFTNRVKHAGGHWVWIEGTVTNLLHVPSVNGVVTNFRDVSERKKNEELLEKNHVELQQALDTQASILNALPPNIALLNEHGKILAVNQSWKKFANSNNLGLPNYGIGYNYLTISEKATGVDKITAVKIAKGIKAVIAGSKKEYCMEYPCHAPNQKRWFQMQVSPLVDKAQRGAVVLHINITARKIAENKQLESEGRYRQIVETAQEGIWLLDDKNRTVFVNKKMCDILGYTAREMMGRTHYSFKDAEEKKKAKKRTERRKQGISETSEATFITKSGKLVWTNGSANGIFDADGKYKGALGMFTDITQRKLDEGAIKRSEANLSAIIENTTDQVYSLDKELRFISFNKQFKNKVKRIFNRDVQQGDNAMDLLVGSDPLEISEWRIVYAKGLVGEVLQFVKEFNEDGKKAFISFSINPIKEAGKVIGLSCFARDITQQKTDDEALKRSEANLFGIIENTSDMVYSLDTDLRYIAFNSAFKNNLLQAYGFDLKQGDHILAYLDGPRSKEANGWKKIYAEALTGKTLQFVKEFNVNKNRSYISFSINPIWNSNEVIGLSCFTRDITQQKTDEIALKKSEASMRTIFNNTDMSYVLIDASLKVVSFNSLAELYATEQLNKKLEAGDSVFDYFDNGRRTLIADVLKQAKAGSLVHYQVNYD